MIFKKWYIALAVLFILSTVVLPLLHTAQAAACQMQVKLTYTDNLLQRNHSLLITNTSTVTCNDVMVSFYYDDAETYQSSQPRPSAGNYYWYIWRLTPQQSSQINVTTTVTTAGQKLHSEACVTATNGEDTCAISQSGTVVLPTPNPTATPVPAPTPSSPVSVSERGLWFWTSVADMSPAQHQSMIQAAAANKINTIYLTIDDVLPILNQAASATKQQQLTVYQNALYDFITYAHSYNIAVDAEAGAKDWATTVTKRQQAVTLLDFVASYNDSYDQDFRGIQYDVEPYLLSTYEKNKATVLQQFITLVDQLAQRAKDKKTTLSLVIPHFYDAQQQWTPAITYQNRTDYTFNHIVRLLNGIPQSSILIMAYRNFASGPDSSVDISDDEVNYASANSDVKVIVAQEMGNVQPGYVTFFGHSRAQLEQALTTITTTLASQRSFGGIAINYLEPFLALP